jgi:hypothetical protein
MQPTLDFIRNDGAVLEFLDLACPPKEQAEDWLRIVNDKHTRRDHRVAAMVYLLLRHGNGKTLPSIKGWTRMIGVKDGAWARLEQLGGYVPIRKLNLDDGLYRLQLKLARNTVISVSIQLDGRGFVRESAAVIFDGTNVRRVLHSCS